MSISCVDDDNVIEVIHDIYGEDLKDAGLVSFLAGPMRQAADIVVMDRIVISFDRVMLDWLRVVERKGLTVDAMHRDLLLHHVIDPHPASRIRGVTLVCAGENAILAFDAASESPRLLGIYLGSQLAVDPGEQRRGIGRALVIETWRCRRAFPGWHEQDALYTPAGFAASASAWRALGSPNLQAVPIWR